MAIEGGHKLFDHLFRHESGKMVAALVRSFGFDHLETAEDIVQDTFIQAVETWKIKGTPDNPQGWLYKVAKNKATDHVRRQQVRRRVDLEVKTAIPVTYSITAHLEQAFQTIEDSQLRLLYSVCHPGIPTEAQVALALKTLGGFGIQEIANAFLTTKETINKRLYRAREKIKKDNIPMAMPPDHEIAERTENVMKAIYLLFNEGYYSQSRESVVRKDLCLEAMRLGILLGQSDVGDHTDVNALLALMCFHASRLESRVSPSGNLISWKDQDRSQWNQELIERGTYYLQRADPENMRSRYQIECAIAYHHTFPDSTSKWEALLTLYDRLTKLNDNPMVSLNLAFVIGKARGHSEALQYVDSLKELQHHYLTEALRGELLSGINPKKAIHHLKKALSGASLEKEKKALEQKIQQLVDRTT